MFKKKIYELMCDISFLIFLCIICDAKLKLKIFSVE